MNSDEIVAEFIDVLEAEHVPYLLVGSLSVNQYAIPRSTHDADFVVQHQPGLLATLTAKLRPDFRLDPQLRFETITGTYRNVITVEDSEFCIELFRLSSDAHDQMRFQRRVRGGYLGRGVWIPTAEDVIVWKLRWAASRVKDQEDVREILSVSGGRLDWPYIHEWTAKHETRELLDAIVARVPPDLLEPAE